MPQARTFRSQWRLAKLLRNRAAQGAVLIVLCGTSHAGKSRFAHSLGPTFNLISSDRIRSEFQGLFERDEIEKRVWRVFEGMKRYVFKHGDNVILDACHMSKKARRHALRDVPPKYSSICVLLDVPWKVARTRCLQSGRLPLKEVRRMWLVFQRKKPSLYELKQAGFAEVYVLKSSRR